MPNDVKNKSLLSLWLMLAVFAAPVFLASTIYYFRDSIGFSTNQHGQFFAPPFNLKVKSNTNNKKWKILFLTNTNNSQDIIVKDNLVKLRQILANDKTRIEIVVSNVNDIAIDENNHEASLLNNGRIIIIDPNDKAIMHYSREAAPQGILKDVQRLLKYSNV